MRYIPISATDSIYSCAEILSLQRIIVDHAIFKRFWLTLRSLSNEVGEDKQDPYWKDLLRPVRQLGFRHMAAPIPFDHRESIALADQFAYAKRTSDQVVPQFSGRLNELENHVQELVHTGDNPLLGVCAHLLDGPDIDGGTALVVCRGSLVRYVDEVLVQIHAHGPVYRILTGAQLKDADCYGRLVIFGHENWFRDTEHVFTAPRAREIYLVGYSWIRGATRFGSEFIVSQVPARPLANPIVSGLGMPVEAEAFDPEEILPVIDLQSIIERMNLSVERQTNESGLNYLVESQIVEFEEDQLVFLESGDRRHHVIDFDGAQRPTVVTLTVKDLQPGLFLVLRISGGGGDYIEFIADRILGNHAQECRDAQNSWKARLRQIVSDQGMDGVVQHLAGQGCRIASPQNVRAWMAPRSIRTQEASNFKILMDMLGLGPHWEEIWAKMEAINSAHQSAGHHIRRSLLEQIKQVDPQELESLGRKDFVLPQNDGGTLAALRIRRIHDEILEIPHSEINQLLTLD